MIDGRARRPAIRSSCFWTIGTSSIGSSIPRSPRATITQSAERMISSAASTACGFSILAISGSRVCLRTVLTSSAVRTNDSATRSTPIDSPNLSSSRSSSGTAGSPRVLPGMLSPWREATAPPTATIVSTSHSSVRTRLTRSRIAPSARYITSSGSTASASPRQLTDIRVASPIRSDPHTSVSVSPTRSSAMSSLSAPIRSFGPGRSWRIATWRPAADAAARMRSSVLGVQLEVAVREVEPGDVHPRVDHPREHLGLAGGGPDRGDDLRPAHLTGR